MCCSAASIRPTIWRVDPWALASADLVVAVTSHLPESLRGVVHVVLPIGTFAETSGTYVNAEGRWQSWAGAAKLPGESRPGWKVLRVLANLLDLHGIDYNSSDEIRDALKALCGTRLEAGARDCAAPSPTARFPRAPGWTSRRTKAMCWCAAPSRCKKPRTGA